jgi:hypothetical protein
VVALALQLGDDHEREHDVVLGEAEEGCGIGDEYRRVQDERVLTPTAGRTLVLGHLVVGLGAAI